MFEQLSFLLLYTDPNHDPNLDHDPDLDHDHDLDLDLDLDHDLYFCFMPLVILKLLNRWAMCITQIESVFTIGTNAQFTDSFFVAWAFVHHELTIPYW